MNHTPETLYIVARKLVSLGYKVLSEEVAEASVTWLTEQDTASALLEALRYYADPENYAEDHWGIRDVIVEHGKAGAKARAAIAKAGVGE